MDLNIIEPTLLLHKEKCLQNIKTMSEKAQRNGIIFRPHFKTHQSHEVGRWFREYGVDRITVSSLRMAAYFAQDNWNDIMVAFPVNVLEAQRINNLAATIDLSLIVESTEIIRALQKVLKYKVNLYVKVDIGYHRTGINPENITDIDEMIELIEQEPLTTFKGFLGHGGHSYNSRSNKEIENVHNEGRSIMIKLRKQYAPQYPDLIISIGDTPTCSVMQDFSWTDEMRPGNFVFYDLMQHVIGSCSLDQIALSIACPVVAKHADRGELVIYGGGVHFSKDRIQLDEQNCYGIVIDLDQKNRLIDNESILVKSLSQEHGIISAPEDYIDNKKIGDIVHILPIHSCMASNLLRSYTILDT